MGRSMPLVSTFGLALSFGSIRGWCHLLRIGRRVSTRVLGEACARPYRTKQQCSQSLLERFLPCGAQKTAFGFITIAIQLCPRRPVNGQHPCCSCSPQKHPCFEADIHLTQARKALTFSAVESLVRDDQMKLSMLKENVFALCRVCLSYR